MEVCLIAASLLRAACTSTGEWTTSNATCDDWKSVGLSGAEGSICYTDTPSPCYTGTGGSTGYVGYSGVEGGIGY